MSTPQEKYPSEVRGNHRLRHDSNGQYRGYKPWTPHRPTLPIDAGEQALIKQVESVLAASPTYATLEGDALTHDTVVNISDRLSFLGESIVFLENDTTPIREPQDKPLENGPIYYRKNWRMRVGTSEDITTRLAHGLAVSSAVCDRFGDTIRQRVLWYGAYGILLDCDEFQDGTETKSDRPPPCYSMDTFLEQYPNLKEVVHYIIPSSRSLFEGRPFKARAWLPFEIPIFDYRVFQKIGDKLIEMFAFLPQGVVKNGIAAAFGAAHNAHQARHFDGYISRDFIEICKREVCAEEQQRKREDQERKEKDQAKKEQREQENIIRTELEERGHDKQNTRSPIQAFREDVNPIDFMQDQGWITPVGGNMWNWHESEAGKSCEIDLHDDNNVIIKPFSASMQDASPNADRTKPVGGHRFILYHLYKLDISVRKDLKKLLKILANEGYGTSPDDYRSIREAERRAARQEGLLDEQHTTASQPSSETETQFEKSILDGTLEIPEIEVRETPAYSYWTPEQRIIVEKIFYRDPDAGYYEGPTGDLIPAFTTAYHNLYRMTHLEIFKTNGQSTEIEKRRIFSTQLGVCPNCYGTAALSIDRYLLTAHAFCPKCDKDIQIGSYLNYELKRKVDNAIVSKYQGYLGKNPDFERFELFRSGLLTYLGAAMATGKTTEIIKEIVRRVISENRRGIICVPRVSLARALAYFYRKQDGEKAWGLWHEGSGRENQFIGTHGAIICLPSLHRVVAYAKIHGIAVADLLIAIDELDFSYQLLNLVTAQKLQIKRILRQAVNTNGLVVAGQTESTLALEAFAAELGLGVSDIHGFYNTATTADGIVEIRRYPDIEGKTDFARAGAVDCIRQKLQAGKNVYTFSTERRDVAMLEEIFKAENPVLYTAYHKGDSRADAVLLNQKLTDTKLFLATSSAGIGINILDPEGETVILAGPLYGSQDIAMVTQEQLRNRARTDVTVYLPHLNKLLPIAPSETEAASLYEQGLKILGNKKYRKLPEDAIKHLAHSTALASLADADPMTFFQHHIEDVAGLKVVEIDAEIPSIADVQTIKDIRKHTRDVEQKACLNRVLEILYAPTLKVLTSTEIRAAGAAGKLIPMPIEQLAQERINHAAQALGWDDTEEQNFSFIDKILLIELILNIPDLKELRQQYKGWIVLHYKDRVHRQFEQQIDQNQHIEGLTAERGDLEITDIEDIRTAGALLTTLLETLIGTIYTENTLADTVREVLKTRHGNETFLHCLRNGALGIQEYRATRWLDITNDTGVVKWVRDFIARWYPVRIAKRQDDYFLTPEKHVSIKLRVFQRCFNVQSTGSNKDFDGRTPPFIVGFSQPPNPHIEEKAHAILLVMDGATPKEAAEKTGLPYETVRKLTKYIRDTAKAKQLEQARELRREGNTLEHIADQFQVKPATASRWCEGIDPTDVVTFSDEKLQIHTCNWEKGVRNVTYVTLHNRILEFLNRENCEKTTSDILEAFNEVSARHVYRSLKELVESGQIIKVKRGVYALPPASEAIPQDTQAIKLTEKELWYAIYLIHNVLLDTQMRTRTQIALELETELPRELYDTALDYMSDNLLVNVGSDDTFGLDSATQQRCLDFVLSQTRLPNLVLSHYYLSMAIYCQRDIDYWCFEGKLKLIEKVWADGAYVTDWEQAISFVDEHLASIKETLKKLEANASLYNQKATLEVKTLPKQS